MPGTKFTIDAETSEAADQIQEFFNRAQEGAERLTGAGEFFDGLAQKIALAFSVDRLVEWTASAIETAAQMGLLAQKTGVGVEQLSKLTYAFETTHVSAEKFQMSVRILADIMGKAAQGDAAATKTLQQYGITATTVDGALLQLADKFKAMPDGIEKTTTATMLLGRAGEDLIPALNKGSEGLKALGDAAEAAGLVISEDAVRASEQFETEMGKLKAAGQGLFIQFSQQILPVLQSFTSTLNETAAASKGSSDAVLGLSSVFRAVSAAALGTYNIFASLATLVGAGLAAAFERMRIALETVTSLMVRAEQAASGLRAAVAGVVQGMSDGNFWKLLAGAGPMAAFASLAGQQDVGKGVGLIADAAKGAATDVIGFVQKSWSSVYSIGQGVLKDLGDRWKAFAAQRDAILNGGAASGGAAGPVNRPAVYTAPDSDSQTTKAGLALIDQISAAYTKAIHTQEQQLDEEYRKTLETLEEEVRDQEQFSIMKAELDAVYFKKKKDLADKAHEETLAYARAELNAKKDAISGDTDLTEMEKARQLIPVLQQENALFAEQERMLKQKMSDSNNDADRLKFAKELLSVEQEQVKTQQALKAAQNETSFFGQMHTQLVSLSSEWGNLAKNMATTLSGAIKTGVNGVSDAIMGAITHTKTWGQVFLQVGQAILSSLIKVVVQWIANKTIIAAMNAIFGAEQATQAGTLAAAWAPAAMAASIATEGEADAAGEAGYWAAMGSADAGSFFAEGGLVDRPTLAMVGEGGEPEVILPMSKIGSFMAAVASGAMTARGMSSAAIASLPRGGGGGGAGGARGGGGTGAAAGAGTTVNVPPGQFHAYILNTHAEIVNAIKTNPMVQHAIVGAVRKNKMSLGIG